ncbi:MAG: bifunctional demethylmenaquinone methyltransferase/2-methoxy-6-polyprenyl-1,4-benzoquinol methylase UbiE [Opitutus sp.]|nr:bifunctional demethylmenaquinone methyltransferase/2-methoxy-6-polyprenyl-1,4-benzoquinol methylase UbiE [Opitutus sp.]
MPDSTAVNTMFGRIAHRYDFANRLLSFGTDVWWRHQLVAAVGRAGSREVLDLATGSGDVAFALARRLPAEARIIGVDFCQPMLDEAIRKQAATGISRYANITFRHGDGLALPLVDASVDAVTIAFGLRNLADRARGLREMRRVLRPGGRLFVLEFSQPATWFRPLYFFYLRKILPFIAGLATGDRAAYAYLNETIEQFPDRATLAEEIGAAGFTGVAGHGMTFGIVALHQAIR